MSAVIVAAPQRAPDEGQAPEITLVEDDDRRPLPDFVVELADRSVALFHAGHVDAAITMLKRAIRCEQNCASMWANLGHFFWQQRKFKEAEAALQRAIRIERDHREAHCSIGLAFEGQRRYDGAMLAFNEALRIDPDYANPRWNRGLLNLGLGNYAEGFVDYDARIVRRPEIYRKMAAPLWQGESLKGKTIYVASEQGIGDTILFSRFLPWLARQAKQVKVCLRADQLALLWDFRDLVEFVPEKVPVPQTDYSVFMGSIPRYWFESNDDIPADPGLIRQRVDLQMQIGKIDIPELPLADGIKVGICWTGNPAQERNDERSVPFDMLAGLAEIPQAFLFGLQAPPANDAIYRAGMAELVLDLGVECMERGLAATGTALLQMDVVVTTCTSIAHLAGALGVPTWLLLCHDPYWCWGYNDSDKTPWYPSIRLIRQQNAGDWRPVIDRVRDDLLEMVAER